MAQESNILLIRSLNTVSILITTEIYITRRHSQKSENLNGRQKALLYHTDIAIESTCISLKKIGITDYYLNILLIKHVERKVTAAYIR